MTDLKVYNVDDKEIEIQYEDSTSIGRGSFGTVSKCKLIKPVVSVIAIKRVLQDKRFKNRELQIMKTLDNEHIVKLFYYNYDTSSSAAATTNDNGESTESTNNNNLYLNLIMEYLPTTLYKRNQHFTLQKTHMPLIEVQQYTIQIMSGLEYLHSHSICHRDIKPQNILVNCDGAADSKYIAKICDFGSAKILNASEQNVSYICSRYYRAPELIFGATKYTVSIDIWSTGCVIAELLLGQPLFPGESGIDQLVEIIKVLGTPTHSDILSMNSNYIDHKFPLIRRIPLNKIFKNADPQLLNLLDGLLRFNPEVRLTAKQSLQHQWLNDLITK